jgi:hypothetical protein
MSFLLPSPVVVIVVVVVVDFDVALSTALSFRPPKKLPEEEDDEAP